MPNGWAAFFHNGLAGQPCHSTPGEPWHVWGSQGGPQLARISWLLPLMRKAPEPGAERMHIALGLFMTAPNVKNFK